MEPTTSGETPQAATETDAGKTEAKETPKTMTVEDLQAKLDEAQRHAKNKEEEAARVQKKLEKFEQAEHAKAEAEKSELQKANDRALALEAQLKQRTLEGLRRDAAAAAKLPAEFVDRLKGETLEELTADAEKLAKAIPATLPPKGSPTNPGQAQTGETEAERRKRLGI